MTSFITPQLFSSEYFIRAVLYTHLLLGIVQFISCILGINFYFNIIIKIPKVISLTAIFSIYFTIIVIGSTYIWYLDPFLPEKIYKYIDLGFIYTTIQFFLIQGYIIQKRKKYLTREKLFSWILFQFSLHYIVGLELIIIDLNGEIPPLLFIIDSLIRGTLFLYLLIRTLKKIRSGSKNNEIQINKYNNILSEREKEVFLLLLEGKSYKEISIKLNISPLTVKKHASNIYTKTTTSGKKELQKSVYW